MRAWDVHAPGSRRARTTALAALAPHRTRHRGRPNALHRSGVLPPELYLLSKLQWLALAGNQLGGPPPDMLGTLPALKGAILSSNALAGPLPEAWCANNATYAVDGNANLCGACQLGLGPGIGRCG